MRPEFENGHCRSLWHQEVTSTQWAALTNAEYISFNYIIFLLVMCRIDKYDKGYNMNSEKTSVMF